MPESLDNVTFGPAANHRSEPFFLSLPPGWFVGTFVKTSFRTKNGGKEFMWVRVTGIRGRVLVGALNNEPIYDCGVQSGDQVTVRRARIRAVLPGEGLQC